MTLVLLANYSVILSQLRNLIDQRSDFILAIEQQLLIMANHESTRSVLESMKITDQVMLHRENLQCTFKERFQQTCDLDFMKMLEIAIFAPFLGAQTPQPCNIQAEECDNGLPHKLIERCLEYRVINEPKITTIILSKDVQDPSPVYSQQHPTVLAISPDPFSETSSTSFMNRRIPSISKFRSKPPSASLNQKRPSYHPIIYQYGDAEMAEVKVMR